MPKNSVNNSIRNQHMELIGIKETDPEKQSNEDEKVGRKTTCEYCTVEFKSSDVVVTCRPSQKPHIYHLHCLVHKASRQLIKSDNVKDRQDLARMPSCQDCQIKTEHCEDYLRQEMKEGF